MIPERTYEYKLKLPNFRGKARIGEALRHLLRPKVSRIIHDIAMELDPEDEVCEFKLASPDPIGLMESI